MKILYLLSNNIETATNFDNLINSDEISFRILTNNDKILEKYHNNSIFSTFKHDCKVLIDFKNKNKENMIFISIEENLLSIMHELQHDSFYQTCKDISVFINKIEMKRAFFCKNILTAKYQTVNYDGDLPEGINFPFIAKPANAFASVGVKKIENARDYSEHKKKLGIINSFIVKDKMEYFICEDYIFGEEYSADLFWHEGKHLKTIICYKGYVKGSDLCDRLYTIMEVNKVFNKIEKFCINVNKKLGMLTGVTHTEVVITKEGSIFCIETTCRPGGAGSFLQLQSKKDKIDYFQYFYNLLLGEKNKFPKIQSECNGKRYFFYNCPFWFSLAGYEIEFNKFKHKLSMVADVSTFLKDNITDNEDLTLSYKTLIRGFCACQGNKNIADFNIMFEKEFNNMQVEKKRYQRQIILPEINNDGQKTIGSKTIAIIGCGGLGSLNILYLAALGVKKLLLIDYDIVEYSNLNRQIIHNENDISSFKAVSAMNKATLLNSNIEIECACEMLDADNCEKLLVGADIIIDAVDNIETRYILDDYSTKYNVATFFAAVEGFNGFVYFKNGNKSKSYSEIFPKKKVIKREIGVVGSAVGIVSSIQVNEVIKYILGLNQENQKDCIISIDMLRNVISLINLAEKV